MKQKLLVLMIVCAFYAHDGSTTASAEIDQDTLIETYIQRKTDIDNNSISLIEKHIPKYKKHYNKDIRLAIREMSGRLGIEEEWFYLLLKKESGGNPQAVNRQISDTLSDGSSMTPLQRIKLKGRATGLIQFMPATARGLETTQEEIYHKDMKDHLKDVESYLNKVKDKRNITYDSFLSLYLAVFYPYSIDKAFNVPLGIEVSEARARSVGRQNKGIDRAGNNNGLIEKSDIEQWIS